MDEKEQWIDKIAEQFIEYFNYCSDCHDHENAEEYKDCFMSMLQEKLDEQLEDMQWAGGN